MLNYAPNEPIEVDKRAFDEVASDGVDAIVFYPLAGVGAYRG